MRTKLSALTVAAVAAGTLGVSTIASAPATYAASASFQTRMMTAMDSEAFSYAEYNAYADNAGTNTTAADTWHTIADVEYWDHFVTEAKDSGLVGTNTQDLRKAIAAEADAMTSYNRWATIADAEGCHSVATDFREIRKDEVLHHTWFSQALSAMTKGGTIPTAQGPQVTAITVTTATCDKPATQAALLAAMHSESMSWGQYTQWAQHAANTGHPKLASLFTTIGAVELTDHFAKEANTYGLVHSVQANLGTSIAAETSAIAMYTGDIAWAKKQHRTTLASDLSGIRSDEVGHRASFRALLS